MSNSESIGELHIVRLCDIPERKAPTRRGRWRHNKRTNELEFWDDLRGRVYWIDLDTMTTAASCLDWIFQVSKKRWMTHEDRGNLLEAIRDTVDPQAKLCSFGIARARTRT